MKSSLYGYLLKELEKKLNGKEKKIKEQNWYIIIAIICLYLLLISILILLLDIFYDQSDKLTVQSMRLSNYIKVLSIKVFLISLFVMFVMFLMVLILFIAHPNFKIRFYDKERDTLFESMISDESLFNRLNQIIAKSPDKNMAINVLISDSKYEHKLDKPVYRVLLEIIISALGGTFLIKWIMKLKWMLNGLDIFGMSLFFIMIIIEIIIYGVHKKIYKNLYINILDLKKGTLEVYIKDYVTGCITCKWDIFKEGDNVVLKIHSGLFDPGQLTSNINNSNEINKIVIDPGVIAPKDSAQLFENFSNVKEFVGLSNLDTSQVTNMHEMFVSCGAKELDLSGWDTSKVTDMGSMFLKCLNLEKVNVKGWDTTNVKDMSLMFFYCPKLHKLDLSNFKTPNLKMGEMMFGEDSIYDLDIRNLESSKKGTHMLFERSLIYKITVGPKFKDAFSNNDTFHDSDAINRPFEEDGIPTSKKWVALDGPNKGSKKDPYEMKNVTRTQPVTYEVEHMPLENKNNHSYNQHTLLWRMVKRLLGLI